MATLAVRGTAVIGTPVSTVWASTANAVDGAVGANPATYATWTNSTSSAVGSIEIGTFNFASSIGASDTLNSVTVKIRSLVGNTGRVTSVQYQPYDGSTAIGTIQSTTLSTTVADYSATFPVTLAQLRSANFKVRVTITHAANTQSLVFSLDHVDVTADYTPLPPSITQAAYRFYADGTETGATALAAQDTAPTVDTSAGDVNVQLRARLQSTSAVDIKAADDFQLQWERNASGTWTNLIAAGAVLADSYETTASQTGLNAGIVSFGQSFLGNGQRLLTTSFLLNKTASPTATLTGYLYAHAGTYGTSSTATGSPLATSTNTIDAASLTTTPTWTSFNFDATLTLTNGTPYIAVVTSSIGSDNTNYVGVGNDNVTLAHAGNRCRYASPSWAASSGQDLSFRVYTEASPAIVPFDSANLTDGAATTNRLTGGSGSFTAGEISETGLVSDLGWSGNNHTELLYSLTLKSADLTVGDTLRFRILYNGATTAMTYTQTPTLNVGGGAPGAVALAGSSTATSTTTGALIAARPLAATAAASSTAGATTVAKAIPLASTADGTSTATATTLTMGGAAVALAATATGTSTAAATTVVKAIPLTAPTVAGTSTATATALGKTIALAATVPGSSTAAATGLANTIPLAATATATSAATATGLAATIPLTATSAATSSTTGTFVATHALTASATGLSTTTGNLFTVAGGGGTSSGNSTTSGLLAVAHTLTGTTTGTGTGTGLLAGTTALNLVKIWTGTAFTPAPVKVWTGSAFVAATKIKTWDGTKWVPEDLVALAANTNGASTAAATLLAAPSTVLILNDPLENMTNWTNNGATTVAARNGNGADVANFSDMRYTAAAGNQSATWIATFSFKTSNLSTGSSARAIISFRSDTGATNHNQLSARSDGHLEITGNGSANIATSAAGVIAAATWYTIQVTVTLHDTVGAAQVKVDGTPVINVTGVDTKNGGTKTVYDAVWLMAPNIGGGISNTFDDFILERT